ncbi:MAG: hypothetical protein P4M01_05165 [Acidobacteriota bacterium]|nr:hypothetical protein [Acidobacteriota bacterium]
MRLNINLATKPYLDVRRILVVWGGATALLAVVTFLLVGMAVSSWRESRDVSGKIATVRADIAELDRQHNQAQQVLESAQNTGIVDTSRFLNGLIARKSFSWTRAFMQLEEIMPPRLHVVSITPQLDARGGSVNVALVVAGTSREAAVDLVKRLEQSASFKDARITEESDVSEKNSIDTVRFHLTAVYVPGAHTERPAVKSAALTGGRP